VTWIASAALGAGGHRKETLTLRLFARNLARPAHGFARLAGPALGGLLIGAAALKFAKETLALKLLLQDLECLVDVVVADEDLQDLILSG
jgi:hypothetical protein